MSDIAIRVENCILSSAEGLSKLYPSTRLRAGRIGRAQQRHDTPSTGLRTGLRDAISDFRLRIADSFRRSSPQSAVHNLQSENLWALKDVSFEVKRGEVVGIPSTEFTLNAVEVLRAGIGRNGAGNPRNNTRAGSTLLSAGLRARLKILSRSTEPTGGRMAVFADLAAREV